jgi:hypothetical protein
MFHCEVFRSSLASGATDVLQQVTYLTTGGSILAPSASGLQVSAYLNKLHSLWGVSAHLENISPQAASMLPLPYPNLSGNNVGTAVNTPPSVWDFARAPKPLRPTETFNVFASQTSAGAETVTVFVQFTDGIITPAPAIATQPAINGNGMFVQAHATGTTTLTANAFTQVTPTLDNPLPAGQYALVGARVVSAHALAFRMAPINEPLWRPGAPALQAPTDLDFPNARYVNPLTGTISPWGVWFTFFQNTVPNVQIFSTAADTVEDFWFDIIKISDVVTASAL